MTTERERLAQATKPAEDALRLHPLYKGKVQMMPKVPIRSDADIAIWYTPGVAAPCREIEAQPDRVYEHTNKGNTIAIVSDGSRVLGLGDIGPEAGLPVMEGKALLFKYLGGIDAVPLCLHVRSPDEIVRAVQMLEPSFGGINLEDIAQPQCFRVLDELRRMLSIPVWHDDQQGTATVVLAGLLNALKVVGKDLRSVRIAMIGAGAGGIAIYRLLRAYGLDPRATVACDSQGVLHPGRHDIKASQDKYAEKWRICLESNSDGLAGGVAEALHGADVCLAFSRPGPEVIRPEWAKGMARDAIVFACPNPVPEIWPWDAKAAGARIVATGRSDFPNQVNNSLAFPGIFRGVLDVRAARITDEIAFAAAEALAALAEEQGLTDERILPGMGEIEVTARVAVAAGMKAQEQGLAGNHMSRDALHAHALDAIQRTRAATELLLREQIIPSPD